jgi:hypothetical protein
MRARAWVAVALILALATTPLGAGSNQRVEAVLADTETPEHLLLDVGIHVFDPGLVEDDEHMLEEQGIYPGVRKSEARFIPFHLKNTLESTGHWGAVRVLPSGDEAIDVRVSGEIVLSTGKAMVLKVRMSDARGRVWREKRYKHQADPLAYTEIRLEDRDPYQNLYNRIANDMLEELQRLDEADILEIREVARLRFAAELAPVVFAEYVRTDKKGRHRIERLPAEDEPMMDRIARIRERDYMFVDTLNEYYADFYARMGEPYDDWRRYSFEEQMALQAIRREARTKKILGGLMILGAAMAGGGSTVERVARDAAAIGGAITLKNGIEQGKEGKIHVEALKELAASFDAEMEPLLVEVDGQTLRLEGSAETQYAEWRRLLAEIFATETGLPVDPDDAPQLAAADAVSN